MPRTTHPVSRHRHDRGRLRFETDRIVAARRRAVRHRVDHQFGGGWREVGLRRLRLEDYLVAGPEEARASGWENRLNYWTWIRVRQLSERRDPLRIWGHDCGWSSEWCEVCCPRRASGRQQLRGDVARLLAQDGGWRAEVEEPSYGAGSTE